MGLWVVAAAAGAGYLAKFWQNVSQDREGSLESPSGSSIPNNSQSTTLIQQTCKTQNGFNLDSMLLETPRGDNSILQNVTPISDLEHEKQGDSNVLSSSISPPQLMKNEKFEHKGVCTVDYDIGEIPEYPTWEMRNSYGSEVSKNSSRSKCLHLQFIKPRSSLDSCLMAQMYRKDAEIEDFLLSPLASPCSPTVRSFLVTDGRRVISKASNHCRNGREKEVCLKANDSVIGIPSLPKFRKTGYSKLKLNEDKKQLRKSCYIHFDSQGSASGQVFFSYGISIGITFTIIANKLEVEKLKESLKQTEILVEDLQEELEMKDSLTVKELVNDDDSPVKLENRHGKKELNWLSGQADTTVLIKCDDEEFLSPEKNNSMSKIEAELEAELERLELSMEGSSRRLKLPASNEDFDEDIMAELVHGELTDDIVRRRSSSEPSPDRGSSGPSTPLSAKQGVSPHGLSLRLHEVIKSRLEEQIKELEVELAKSQKHVQHLESKRIISWRDISNSESSSTLGSPITIEAYSPMARPLAMNLSGDALDAYNETYEELDRLKGSQNGSSQVQINFRGCTIPSSEDSLDSYEDKVDDLLLIKQIVEKARQGSPAFLRAQKTLVYLNKDEN